MWIYFSEKVISCHYRRKNVNRKNTKTWKRIRQRIWYTQTTVAKICRNYADLRNLRVFGHFYAIFEDFLFMPSDTLEIRFLILAFRAPEKSSLWSLFVITAAIIELQLPNLVNWKPLLWIFKLVLLYWCVLSHTLCNFDDLTIKNREHTYNSPKF